MKYGIERKRQTKKLREHSLLSRAPQFPGTHFFKARHANSQANVQRWQFLLTTLSTQVAHRAAIVFRARVREALSMVGQPSSGYELLVRVTCGCC